MAASPTPPAATPVVPPPPAPPVAWTEELADEAVAGMRDPEMQLLFRLASARGRRVPVSELAEDLGLPAETALEQDFPALWAFCAGGASRPPMPVAAKGSGDTGWYWMAPFDAGLLRSALGKAMTGASSG